MQMPISCNVFLYTDDSALVRSGENPVEIENFLGNELQALSKWLVMNKLSFHLGKIESIVFAWKHHIRKISKLNIICNEVHIKSKDKVKYLGATLGQNLSGRIMGNLAVKEINAGIKFIW